MELSPNPVALVKLSLSSLQSFHSGTNLAKPGWGHFSDVIKKKKKI